MDSNKLTAGVIIPALNEEKHIQEVIKKTLAAYDRLGIAGEVIVVNDGSSDRTPDLVKELSASDSRVKLISHPSRQGIGAAFWDGVDACSSDIITWNSAENAVDSYENLRYYYLMHEVDIIVPFFINNEARSKFRNFLSKIYLFIINTTFRTAFNYTNGAFLVRRSLLTSLPYRCRGFFFHTNIIISLTKQGYLFAEVPYKISMQQSGKSKSISFSSLRSVCGDYLKLIRDIYFKERKICEFAPDSVTLIRRGRQ